jgi:hypothetical protein
MCKCDVRNNDEMKTKKKMKFSSRVWRSVELTSHHVAELRELRQYRYETRNKENNRIALISTTGTHHSEGMFKYSPGLETDYYPFQNRRTVGIFSITFDRNKIETCLFLRSKEDSLACPTV